MFIENGHYPTVTMPLEMAIMDAATGATKMKQVEIKFRVILPDDINLTDAQLDEYLEYMYGGAGVCSEEIFNAVNHGDSVALGSFEWGHV